MLQSLSGLQSPVECVTFDSTENFVAAGGANGTVKVWDLESGKGRLTIFIFGAPQQMPWLVQNVLRDSQPSMPCAEGADMSATAVPVEVY